MVSASEVQASGQDPSELSNTDAATPAPQAQSDPSAEAPVFAAASAPDASLVAVAQPGEMDGEAAAGSGSSGWEVSVVPYVWASAIKADVTTPQGENIDIFESFTDILGKIKFVFMGALDARHERFVTVQDLIFMSLESSDEGSIGPGLVEAEVDMRTTIFTSLVGYRAIDKGPMFLDVMAGARISSLNVDLDLSGPLQTVERESSETKIGPVIASRFRVPLGDEWGLALYGDLGGFGVTADLSWQLLGTVQYEISNHWRLGAGWRHVAVRQDKAGFEIDLIMTGPFIAFAYHF
jgi:hypothetical protein